MLQKHEKAWSWSYWTRVKVKTGIKGSCSDYSGRSKQKPGHEDLALYLVPKVDSSLSYWETESLKSFNQGLWGRL